MVSSEFGNLGSIKKLERQKDNIKFRDLRGHMNVADFTAMGFVGLDVDAAVRVP